MSAAPAPAGVTRLAVEATRLAGEDRGIGRYVRALLPRLAALRPALSLTLYTRPADLARLRARWGADPALAGRLAVRPARDLARADADVSWYPWNVVRPAPRRGVAVATVMDVVPLAVDAERLRGWRGRRRTRRWRRLYAATAERATLLLVPSRFTAEELARLLGVPAERTRLTLLAADDALDPPGAATTDAALARLGVTRPFALAVGAAEPRKNLAVLDRAMPRVAAAVPGATLVHAGPRAPDAPPAPWRRALGYVSDADLAALYRAAACLVFPSTYEGFGLPVLEAMRAGTPVVCARRASLPEVGGDAAVWVEPDDDRGIADAVVRFMTDAGAREAASRASVAQAARFGWDACARATLAAFDEAAALGPRGADPRGWGWLRGLQGLGV